MTNHCGCKIHRGEETFACNAKACPKETLCIGCVWQCADCQEDFCESHIADLKDTTSERYSVYACLPCQARRNERKAAA